MKATTIVFAAFVAATPAFGAAVPASASEVNVADPYGVNMTDYHVYKFNGLTLIAADHPKGSEKCGDNVYEPDEIKKALKAGSQHSYDGTTVKAKRPKKSKKQKEYPEDFENREPLHFDHCGGLPDPFIEWPILKGKVFMKNDKQLADRIVYKRSKNLKNVYILCGLMTHTGAKGKNGFKECEKVGH